MELITTTSDLASICARMARHPVITVDTEFLRETTYYPLLCVVQMASAEEAVVIDTLAEGIENLEQLRILERERCNHGQGFLFAKPLTPAAIREFFRTHIATDPGALRH